MVLLHLLVQLAPRHGWRLCVAHLNHSLRGASSRADERLVRRTADQLGLACRVETGNVREFARAEKLSIEMAARRLRHEFLVRAARQAGAGTIALAHHADDQVELFFLRLFRGSGSEGLAGMRWLRPSPVNARIRLVRPLLAFTKAELLQFASKQKILFREDASNTAEDILRNRIRHRLLPLLRKDYQPAMKQAVLRAMDITSAESAFAADAARIWLRHRSPSFARLAIAVQRRVVLSQLVDAGLTADFDMVERLRASAKPVSVGPGVIVQRSISGMLELRRIEETGFAHEEHCLHLESIRGNTDFAGLQISWSCLPTQGFRRPKKQSPRVEFFDADQVGPSVILRHWRPGDRFQPIGMPSAVKLQDLFTNARIPAAERRTRVLATTADGDIFWVQGLRIGERFKLQPTTRRRLRLSWERHPGVRG
jgi:tRNA(Ile)-lysidine synthase